MEEVFLEKGRSWNSQKAPLSCVWVEFLHLETAILEFWTFVLLEIRSNGRLGGDFNSGFNNYFRYTEETKSMPHFYFNCALRLLSRSWSGTENSEVLILSPVDCTPPPHNITDLSFIYLCFTWSWWTILKTFQSSPKGWIELLSIRA